MRIFFLIPFLFIVSTAFAEIGFYSKNSPVIPKLVRQSLSSIFLLKMPNYLTMPTEQAKAFLTAINLKEDGRQTIQTCIDRSEIICTFPILKLPGTAFIDSQNDRLWTNCHLIDGWVRYSKQKMSWDGASGKLYDYLKKQKIPLELYNSKNQRLNQPADKYFLTIAHVYDGKNSGNSGCDFRNDAVQFSSSRILGESIPWNKAELSDLSNKKTYIGGYPVPVKRTLITVGNSGKTDLGATSAHELFHWTRGEVKSKEDLLQILRNSGKNPEDYSLLLAGDYSIYVDNDSAGGMSGSPILNEKGEFLGIFRGVIPRDYSEIGQNDFPIISTGINIQGLTFLRYLVE